MNYRIILIIIPFIFLLSCEQTVQKKLSFKPEKKYKNLGFTLIYDDSLEKIRELDSNSLEIYHGYLKRNSMVKITNPINGKSLIAKVVSNRVVFSNFYNSVISSKIANQLELNLEIPYVEITLISKNSTFIADKAKTFDEEKKVAEKAPIDGIMINDLNKKSEIKNEKIKKEIFSYSIKIADFYYEKTAKIMIDRINVKTSLKNSKILKLSKTKYRVIIGPFDDIKSLKESFEKMKSLNFENLEIIKNV